MISFVLIRRLCPYLFALACSNVYAAGPNVLSNSTHYIEQVTRVISRLGTLGNSGSIVDSTCSASGTGWNGINSCGVTGSLVPLNVFPTFYAMGAPGSTINTHTIGFWRESTAVDDRPYKVLTSSSGGYLLLYDQIFYGQLVGLDVVFNAAFCTNFHSPFSNDYPPVVMTNILVDGSGQQVGGSVCGYGHGIEFSMPTGYLDNDGTASAVTATLGGILAVMRQNHPTWTWGDIKGALRQTAGNWSNGWTLCATCVSPGASGSGYGYGDVNFDAANSINSPSGIYLQPPGMTIDFSSGSAAIKLYPYRQTRRVKEVVYSGGTWPSPKNGCGGSACNEYTAAQIAAAGGRLIYTSNGTDFIPYFSYNSIFPTTGSFVALTLDSNGNGSRIESFMPITGALAGKPNVAGAIMSIISSLLSE